MTILRTFTLLLSLLLTAMPALAQDQKPQPYNPKKTYKEIKSLQKDEKFSQVIQTIDKAQKQYPEALADTRLIQAAAHAQFKVAQEHAKSIYLNSKPDTSAYFNAILQQHIQALRLDSCVAASSNPKASKLITKNLKKELTQTHQNLIPAARYYNKKQQPRQAWTFLDTYLDTPNTLLNLTPLTPIFLDTTTIATQATIAAYQANMPSQTLKYIQPALRNTDTLQLALLLQIKAETHQALNQPQLCTEAIKQGYKRFPQNTYFHNALIQHYTQTNQIDSATLVAHHVAQRLPASPQAHLIYGNMLQRQNQLSQAVEQYNIAAQLAPKDSIIQHTLGNAYIQLARETPTQRKQYYQLARTAFEQTQQLAPSKPELWYQPLREVYFKLNLGKQLKKLEAAGKK